MNFEIGKRIDIADCNGNPYLTRWHLLRVGELFALMLHKFHRSDEDRELHDHPWNFFTFILTKGYYEWRDMPPYDFGDGRVGRTRGRKPVWYPRFSLLFRRAEWRHRVEIKGAPVWTLVLRFKRRRDWGFWNNAGVFTQWQNWWRNNCE